MRKSNAPSSVAKRQRRATPAGTTNMRSRPTISRLGRQPFAQQKACTLRYVENATLTTTSGAFSYVFSANGLFDPNITQGGHQPLYFDQSMAIYNQYTVVRSRIKITLAQNSSGPTTYTLNIGDAATPPTSVTQALEQVGAVGALAVGTGGGPIVLKQNWSATKTFGVNPQANNLLRGTSASNPSEQSYYHVLISDSTLGNTDFSFLAELEYDVVFDELKTIALS